MAGEQERPGSWAPASLVGIPVTLIAACDTHFAGQRTVNRPRHGLCT